MNTNIVKYLPSQSCRASRQRGLSVVELMVSLVISMAVVAGSIQVVAGSKKSFIDQDEVTFIQTNARFALDLMGKDIRMAGYMGCASVESVQVANSINNTSGGYISTHGLIGFEGQVDTSTFPADVRATATVGTDAILIRHASDSGELDVKNHVAASATIHLWGDHSYNNGSTLVIADASCRNIGLFQVSGPNGLPAGHIVHNTGAGTNNCTKIIKGDFVCTAACRATTCGGYGTATGGYGPGSKVMAFESHLYYIAPSTVMPGMSALKRSSLNADGAPSTTSEELALGVEDMEIVYGVDSDGNGDVDQFRNATNMDLNGNGTVTEDEWDQVMNVKISLVFRSQNAVLPAIETRTLAGKVYYDKYIRQQVNSTIKIRNRG
jgi:type IV pilus assembly protein PilW